MIRARTCFAAEGLCVDRETNQVSAFGLLESVEAAEYPVALPRLSFFCLWERALADPSRRTAEFTVTVDGTVVARQSIDVDFGGGLRHRSTIRIAGLTLAQPGSITFGIAIAGHHSAEWTIAATRAPAAANATPVTASSGATGLARVWDSGQLTTPAGAVTIAR